MTLLQQEKLAGATLMIFANKQDVTGALSIEEISNVLRLNISKNFENRHWCIFTCSAVTGDGLVCGMDWIVDDISQRIYML